MPDFSKLWGHDVPDGPSQQPVLMIIKLEYYLVRCQELALWKDPKSSLVALAGIHLAFGYVATTSNTVLNLTLWALLSGKYHVDIVNWREIFLTCAIFHLFLCTCGSFN